VCRKLNGFITVILVNPGHDLDELKESMLALSASSPNCAEFMSKYKSKSHKETVKEIKVKWGGKDKQLFPKDTIVTDENCEAVLRMMAVGVGQDVFDVHVEDVSTEEGGSDKKEKPAAKK